MPNNYVLLDRIELNATATSVTFDNIPQTGYTDLKLVMSARDTSTAGANWNGYSFTILPNGLSTNITQRSIFGNGSNVASYSDTSMFNVIDMGSDTANTFSNVEIYIPNYTSSTFKSFSIDGVAESNATNTGMRLSAGLWSSTAAITSLRLNPYSVFAIGSTFSLYGVAKLGTTPAIAPKASGGNVIATDGTYWYHAFLSNGTFTPQVGLSCDYLVVAGGGGGGSGNGGGGGAGGLRSTVTATGGGGSLESAISFASGTAYAVTIGSGGSGGAAGGENRGTSGTASSVSTVSTTGGGGGGGTSGAALSGGSGGGGAANNVTGGARTTNEGYAGGTANPTAPNYPSAGGGGAGAVGTANPSGSAGGAGGAGVAISAFASATNTGVSNYYAGGGGGALYNGGTPGNGGAGGGGNAGPSISAAGISGTTNTGSGGGASWSGSTVASGGNGGSGIIIIRYAV
jgi:hypothetical protein